jgi:uncharacterized protein (UPF0248 family)
MVYPKDVLNRLKWTKGESLDDAMVWYVHRGAPGDLAVVSGDRIVSLGKGFFESDDATIPYHRISMIEYRGKVIFEKKKAQRKKKR